MPQLLQYLSRHPLLVSLTMLAAAALLFYELQLSRRNQAALGTQQAVRLMNQGAAVLDVRDSTAFAAGHLSNARNVPVDTLAAAESSLQRFKDRPVLVYCESGSRAATALTQLRALGFSQVYNLRGGVAAWRSDQLPLVK
jgi:rhodanese-related sulfurtransferase